MIKTSQYKAVLFLLAFANGLLLSVNTIAESSITKNSDWSYSVTPYLWITGQKGKVASLPPAEPVDLDVSFSDVIDNMDMSFMGLFEARNGRFGLFSEIFYIGISTDADTAGKFYSDAEYKQDLWGLSVGASYSLSQNKTHLLDGVVAFRFWDLDNELKLNAGRLPTTKTSEHESWQDTLLGFRGKVWLNQKWSISGWGVTAVAGDSDSAWDVFGAVSYEYSDTTRFSVGYRHQEVDYDQGDFLFDVEMSGPILGVTILF